MGVLRSTNTNKLVALYSDENTRLQNESPSCAELTRTGEWLGPLIATGHGASGT